MVHPGGAAHQEGEPLPAQPLHQAPAHAPRHLPAPAAGHQHPGLRHREAKRPPCGGATHLKAHHTLTSMKGFHERPKSQFVFAAVKRC